ncbi:hypothetical protein OJF2_11270 [Aquisphaera giovannonii]|uniref:Uncharacterized protein n=1 Tax=Aquisphaera giovannonii TaxID=406548 RepID=A0A5B9VWM3_9BACT|nr:hypothetical protein [Aquisphaera giovannonii]QEH32648.1 hypothetical protein OJF2_11270 [Aquisphaera giovannonii]
MSPQAEVRSIDALKGLRSALAIYSEDTLAALGAVEAEVRRTVRWLAEDRPHFWQEQIKRRRELVASAKAEVFKRKLQKKPDYSPSMSEPIEMLRRAEASLADAERRLTLTRKWQSQFNQAVLEYHGATQRLKDLAASDVPRAIQALIRIVEALEAYLRVAPPPGGGSSPGAAAGSPGVSPELESIAARVLDEEPPPDSGDRPTNPAEGADAPDPDEHPAEAEGGD